MTELTEYLIELGKMLGIDTDTEGCVNPNLALSARIVLAIGELRQPLKWKDVADGLPEVRGIYVVIGEYSLSPYLLEYPYDLSNKWEKTVAAYIPYPIPPYKEQR